MTDGSLDRVVGVIHAKDIVPIDMSQPGTHALRGLMRRCLFIYRETSASNLLEVFRAQHAHLAVVVDDYGRTLGLVTRTDLFRHLMGRTGEVS